MKANPSPPRPLGDIIRHLLLHGNTPLAIAWRRRRKKIKRPCRERGAPEKTGT
ncbi:MAG: hypothetical protein PUF55_08065 [Bacteroidales bacterium]|nr:hypothetical protein [Bacteroidales bacterium]